MEDYEERYRGRELPGFINYKTFEVMVSEQMKQLEEPAVKKLKDIGGKWLNIRQMHCVFLHSVCLSGNQAAAFPFPPDAVRRVFLQLASSSFTGFPNLIKTAKVFYKFDIDILNSLIFIVSNMLHVKI